MRICPLGLAPLLKQRFVAAAVHPAAVLGFVALFGQKLIHVRLQPVQVLVIVRAFGVAILGLRTGMIARAVLVNMQMLPFALVMRGQMRRGVGDVRVLGLLPARDGVVGAIPVRVQFAMLASVSSAGPRPLVGPALCMPSIASAILIFYLSRGFPRLS